MEQVSGMRRHSEYIGCYLDLVQGKMVDLNKSKTFGQSPLHMASRLGMHTCVGMLLKRGAKIDALNEEDMTPLMCASEQGHEAVVECLVENGANVNLSNSKGRLALHYSCFGGHRQCTEILLKYKSKLNYPDNEGTTPLILACRSKSVQVVQTMLDAGAKPDKVDNMKRSALHWAALSSSKDVVDALINAGASLDLMDKYYATAFMYSIFNDNAPALSSLVAAGCDSTAIDGMDGTALTLASLKGHNSCVSVLLSAGEDPDEFSYFGMTALMASVYESHYSLTQTILQYKPNVNIVSRLGFTALFAALCHINQNNAETRHRLLVLLIQHGIDINQPFGCTTAFSSIMKGKNSPLLFAVTTGYVSLVKILLYAGSRLNFSEIQCLKNADLNNMCKVSSVLKAIIDYKCKPLPLQHLCRVSIRRQLASDIVAKLENLPVPKTLRQYLNFSDLADVPPQCVAISCSFQDLALTMLDLKACGLQAIEGSFLFEQMKESVLRAQQPGPCNCNICLRIRELQHMLH